MLDRRREEITRAFVDRTVIDWTAVLQRTSNPVDRSALDTLRRLEKLRGRSRSDPEPEQPHAWTTVLRIMVIIGAVQTLTGLYQFVAASASGATNLDFAPHALVAAVLTLASLVLGTAIARDHRVFFLLATFILSASAFARPLLAPVPDSAPFASNVAYRGVYPEAFAQAGLWQFATVFPSVRRFTTFDVIARRAAAASGALGAALFLANLCLAYGWLPEPAAVLGRNHPRDLYWQIFAGTALPALAVIAVRAWRAPWNERVKVVRFACAVAAGSGPILVIGIAESVPRINAWLVTEGIRPWINMGAMMILSAMPILATLAVLVDGPFERRRVVRPGARGWIVRCAERLDTGRTRLLRPRRHRERLSVALDRVRLARGTREIIAVLRRELQASVGADSVAIVQAGALPPGTALLPILEQSSGPIDLSRSGEPFVLLPREDRQWLEASGVALVAAVRLRDGSIPIVILLGHPLRKELFDRSDRWFVTTLLTAVSAAWDAAGPSAYHDECADECARCGGVRVAGSSLCCVGADTRLAALPKRLGDRFIVTRRLGAGAMGVVYLGQDLSLGRDVALKTWAGLQQEMMTRLRDEARLMATLDHEALATIYGVEHWRRTPILVMEYCSQGTLADLIARGGLAVDDVLRTGVRLADGLTYMHGRDLLHRDIKPSNIGFTARGVAKLLDFGIAGADDQPGGTPAYLPPEALQGAPPDTAVDLWALATVLREALGGPGQHLGALDAFFQRALADRPADRFESSQEMRAALSQLLEERKHSARI